MQARLQNSCSLSVFLLLWLWSWNLLTEAFYVETTEAGRDDTSTASPTPLPSWPEPNTDCVYEEGEDEFVPWTAAIKIKVKKQTKNYVPGAILNAHTIITYGRSFVGPGNKLQLLDPSNYTVYVGPTAFNVTPSHPLEVSYVKPYPFIQRDTIYWMRNQNDFVLLHLKTPIPQFLTTDPDPDVRPVCIPPAHDWGGLWRFISQPNTTSIVGGWRKSRDLDLITNELKINSFEYCEEDWYSRDDTADFNFTNRICANPLPTPTLLNPGRECISKDSGVILKSSDKKHYFLGFVNNYYNHESLCGEKSHHVISLASPDVLKWVVDNMRCGPFNYSCYDGTQCVPLDSACNQKPDCADGSDEDAKYCRGLKYCDPELEFECGTYGDCIPKINNGNDAADCNGVRDCPNGEDEENCLLNTDNSTESQKPLIAGLIGVSFFAVLMLPISFLLWRRFFGVRDRHLTKQEVKDFEEGDPDLEQDPNNPLIDIRRTRYDREKFELDPADLKLYHELDKGAFGVVRFATLCGQVVAVKIPRVGKITVDAFISLLVELKFMQYIQNEGGHVNIVRFYKAYTKNIKSHVLQVAMEYCPLGNLRNYLIANRQYFTGKIVPNVGRHAQFVTPRYVSLAGLNEFNPLDMVRWCLQVAKGMAWLASKRLLHGDISARNILQDAQGNAKISDFGLIRQLYAVDEYCSNNERQFPLLSAAPEVLESNGRVHNIKSDVWSFGILMWEIFSFGATPWAPQPGYTLFAPDLLQRIKSGEVLTKPEHANEKLYELMLSCWKLNANDRPSFQQLVDSLEAIYAEMYASAVDEPMSGARSSEGRGSSPSQSTGSEGSQVSSPSEVGTSLTSTNSTWPSG